MPAARPGLLASRSELVGDVQSFIHNASPARILFGAGRLAELGDEFKRLGAKRALIGARQRVASSQRPDCVIAVSPETQRAGLPHNVAIWAAFHELVGPVASSVRC